MKKGKYLNARAVKRANKKLIALALALVLTIGGVVGGTLAWLTSTTGDVVNTFTDSDINITLTESDTDATTEGEQHEYKMVPGNNLPKDPLVTIKANSEASYVFVEVTKSSNFDHYLTYIKGNDWTELKTEGLTTIYYRLQDATTADVSYPVLKDNQVTVKNTVTKADMDAIDGVVVTGQTATEDQELALRPTLTFTAYAIQQANLTDQDDDGDVDAADAWELAKPATP